jgi:Heat-labile enterotoxin alpha chain
VAPAPNMVDVNASLGIRTREPEIAEVAAMGRIDYAQIRGWTAVKNGVAGPFVPNPNYRWDVYNQTRTAGSQPQLARFPIGSDAWHEDVYGAWVSTGGPGNKVTEFNQNPNLLQASFYDNAWEKVRYLQERQAMGLDYRGSLKIDAYGGGDRAGTHLFVTSGGWPAVAYKYSRYAVDGASKHNFSMGEDGRLHLADDYGKVLRVGGDGYVYVGGIPSNANSTNGVFQYDGLHLTHLEDGKFLTVGKTVYTPFVTTDDCGERSTWQLTRPDGKRAVLPRVNEFTHRNKTGGRNVLYRFEKDPDAALPRTAQQFVSSVPGVRSRDDFLGYARVMSPEDVRRASTWLRTHNAAWLFRDGFYIVSHAPDTVEARTLDGVVQWGASVTPDDGFGTFGNTAKLTSNYRIEDDVWKLVQRLADRRLKVAAGIGGAGRSNA